jgi:hypothetical protein
MTPEDIQKVLDQEVELGVTSPEEHATESAWLRFATYVISK